MGRHAGASIVRHTASRATRPTPRDPSRTCSHGGPQGRLASRGRRRSRPDVPRGDERRAQPTARQAPRARGIAGGASADVTEDGHRAGDRSGLLVRLVEHARGAGPLSGESRRVLEKAIDSLPDHYRAVLVLRTSGCATKVASSSAIRWRSEVAASHQARMGCASSSPGTGATVTAEVVAVLADYLEATLSPDLRPGSRGTCRSRRAAPIWRRTGRRSRCRRGSRVEMPEEMKARLGTSCCGSSGGRWAGAASGAGPPNPAPVFQDAREPVAVAEDPHVRERVAVDDQEVGRLAGLDGSRDVEEIEELRGVPGGGDDRVGRRQAATPPSGRAPGRWRRAG